MKRRIRDGILILGILLASATLYTLLPRISGRGAGALSVTVRIDGKEVGTYSLLEAQEIPFDTEYGHNLLKIENGEAFMIEADCPDGYCMTQHPVKKAGETLVCLPHRLVVEGGGSKAEATPVGEGGAEDAPDAIAG